MTDDTAFTVAVLQSMLEAEKAVRRAAEREAAAARAALLCIAQSLAPDLAAQMGSIDVSVTAEGIIRTVRAQLTAATGEAELIQEIAVLKRDLAEARALNQALRADQSLLTAGLDLSRPAVAVKGAVDETPLAPVLPSEANLSSEEFVAAVPPETWPEWLRSWATDRNFASARTFLQVLGETGAPLRSAVADMVARRLRGPDKRRGGTERRAFDNLVRRKLVGLKEARRGKIRRHLIYLTSGEGGNGCDAYRLLFGCDPARQQTLELLKLHSSPDHVYLILETQLLLEQAGYTVQQYPPPVTVPGLGEYYPDLVATYQGQCLYIEAERNTYKRRDTRLTKWQKAWRVAEGRLYVVVGAQSEVDPIFSELAWVAGKGGLSGEVYMLVTEAIVTGKHLGEGWDVWSIRRTFVKGIVKD